MATYTIDALIAGDHPTIVRTVTIAASQTLEKYSVLGVVTETGAYVLRDKDAVDGSKVARAILLDATTTTGATDEANALLHGEVDEDVLVFASGEDIEDVRQELIAAGIYPVARV